MTENVKTIVVNAGREAVEALRGEIDMQPGAQSRVTERKNLAGGEPEWLLIATVAGNVLPHVLGFLKDYLTTKRVKRIKVGDVEVENPTPEIIDQLLRNAS